MPCPAFNEQRDQLARDAGPAARSMKDLLNSASTMRPLFRYIHDTGRFAAAYGDLELKDAKARDRAQGAHRRIPISFQLSHYTTEHSSTIPALRSGERRCSATTDHTIHTTRVAYVMST
ncbi:uncharacterized protein B0H18DRAFT_986012 [Fomitopsis serialis]|uniref:uncharacterized protein n=1 Tax=Fomitopsis serialis TaxID=139415 RepID=UPI0020089D40|nr:uncharacterized protein B0H18DRAFT_986012 [Neoantrodia serialis]KAH9932519.1 hypothetical protein B0H18DRAFT_986012 [Neoantrodia serialis]